MNEPLRIRVATAADAGSVRHLLVETWHDTYDGILGRDRVTEITDAWHSHKALSAQIANPAQTFLVAEHRDCTGSTIVGHALGEIREASVLFLARLYVLPDFQRRGIGRQLLAALSQRHPACDGIRLRVETDNAKAVAFYLQEGFVAVDQFAEGDLRGSVMEKTIAAPCS